jgi:hypothetical protein
MIGGFISMIRVSIGAVLAVAMFATGADPSPLPRTRLKVGGGEIDVEFAEGRFDRPQQTLLEHIERAACAVSTYYGRFPAREYRLLIVPIPGRGGVLTGTTWGFGGAHSRILVGEQTTAAQLKDDWVITHEMVHIAFPTMPDKNHWIEEGIATYVEPLARSWVGDYPLSKVWGDLVSGLPKGIPDAGDEGLDHTHTWGRTYWGGATFCTLADVEIRRRTGNKRGLIDALRAILEASGGISAEWSPERAFEAGDNAVGAPVLEQLYTQMKSNPTRPDLAGLWMQLGVAAKGDLTFDDSAPEAAERRAISSRPSDAPNSCRR